MVPGNIIDMYFPYKSPSSGGKYRPAIIMSIDSGRAVAVAVKITKSGPKPYFPHRQEIIYWRQACLDYKSYAEFDSTVIIPIQRNYRYRGNLHPVDFREILQKFNSFHN